MLKVIMLNDVASLAQLPPIPQDQYRRIIRSLGVRIQETAAPGGNGEKREISSLQFDKHYTITDQYHKALLFKFTIFRNKLVCLSLCKAIIV